MHPRVKIPKTRAEISLEFLNRILSPHQLQVLGFETVTDSKFARGCLSDLVRLELTVQKYSDNNAPLEKLGLVVKTVPSNPSIRSYVLSKGYCQNEVQMYTKVLPALNDFLNSQGVSQANRFSFPKCYFGEEEEGNRDEDYNFFLTLEDLTGSKHTFWDEGAKKSFDWEHSSAAIKSIARFHASTAAYKISKGFRLYEEEFPKFLKHTVDDPALDNYIATGFKATREVLMEGEIPEGLLERLELMETNFKTIVQKMQIDVDEKSVNVVRHTDLHFFNVAFLHDVNDNGVEATWFDFQNCSEGSPMSDLAFLLMLNCEPEFSTGQLDKSLELYHQTFMEVVKETKVNLDYPFEKMREEFSRYRLPSILHIISGSLMWSCGPDCNSVSRDRLRRAIIYAFNNGELNLPDFV
ncbi:unnamed protein product [Allacma fusca]|uniref:CHK kinase-like domain-containing protein n=1 Tax=Allacma fusca TaxID=39272 RepID=A0A8J2JC34_9HEXA|nr:unnamed protein product [Allacma fusca]